MLHLERIPKNSFHFFGGAHPRVEELPEDLTIFWSTGISATHRFLLWKCVMRNWDGSDRFSLKTENDAFLGEKCAMEQSTTHLGRLENVAMKNTWNPLGVPLRRCICVVWKWWFLISYIRSPVAKDDGQLLSVMFEWSIKPPICVALQLIQLFRSDSTDWCFQ